MKYNVDVDKRLRLSSKTLRENCSLPIYVTFSGNFTEDSAKKFREEMEMSENLAIESGQTVLPIVIDSYGGQVYALLSMIDTVKNCSLPVATIVESKAMSCGAVLFSYGTEGYRYVAPRATVMIHSVSSYAFGKVEEMKADVGEADRLNEMVFREMAVNCGHEPEYFLNQVVQRKMADWYLTPQDCIVHNLANHVKIPSFTTKINMDISFE